MIDRWIRFKKLTDQSLVETTKINTNVFCARLQQHIVMGLSGENTPCVFIQKYARDYIFLSLAVSCAVGEQCPLGLG